MQKFLRYEDVPLDRLEQFPGNARRNDVDKLVKSITHHGQYRTLVVRAVSDEDGDRLVILAGNHTYQALCKIASDPLDELGMSATARCEIMTCTQREALEINLVDNKSNDSAFYDEDAMRTQLEELNANFAGTGWDEKSAGKYLDDPGDADTNEDPPLAFNLLVICRDEAQQTDLMEKLLDEGFEVKALTS